MRQLPINRQFFNFVLIASIALVYGLIAKLTLQLLQLEAEAAPWYPAAGFAVAATWCYGNRALVGIAIGAALNSYGQGMSGLALGIGVAAQVLEAGAGSALLHRSHFRPELGRLRDVGLLLGCGVAIPSAINATIGTTTAAIVQIIPWRSFTENWWTYWIGDGVGILVVTPGLLMWAKMTRDRRTDWQFGQWQWSELLLWMTLLVIATWFGFGPKSGLPVLEYVPFLLIVWAALRFGPHGTLFSGILISSVALIPILQRNSLLVTNTGGSVKLAILELQSFVGASMVMALLLAAAVLERQQQNNADQLLTEMVGRIRQSLNLEDIMQTTVDEVRAFLRTDRVYLTQNNPDGHVVAESVDRRYRPILGFQVDPKHVPDLVAHLLKQRIRVTPDTEQDHPPLIIRQLYDAFQVRASINVTLCYRGELTHVLVVNQCDGPRNWQSDEIAFIDRLAIQIELALEHGRLYRQVQDAAVKLEQQVADRTQELQTNLEILQDLNQTKERLLHAVSHDLRTPVLGALMVLQRLAKQTVEPILLARPLLNQLLESSDRQLALIQALLADQTGDNSPLALDVKPLALGSFVNAVVAALEPLLTQYQAQVENQIAATLPAIQADAIHLQRVFDNLITNALRHNSPGVQITITATVQPADDRQSAMLYCCVSDNGIGFIPQSEQLFTQPYLRSQHDRRVTGLGLGLFICHQVIQAHGGKIGVKSQPQQGSQFWFTLPIASDVQFNPALSDGVTPNT
jgi:signal transduction histidine kinase/integral membrane sensor domain MASE1